MKPLRLAALGLVCLLVAAGCAPAATPAPAPPTPLPPTPVPDLIAPVKAWAEAINKGDVDAALAPLADDVMWRSGHWFPSASWKEQVRPAFDYLAGYETVFQVKDCRPQDNRAVCGLSVVDGCCSAAFGAAEGLTGKLEFVYQPDGRVGEISLTLDDPRRQDCERFNELRNGWALVNRAEEYAKLNYWSREGGSIDLKLCQEYAESLKAAPTPAPPTASSPSTATGDVKLTILYDNTAMNSQLGSDWGFAALVETGGHTVLFDTGANGPMLLDNIRQLNVKPESIEAIIISHEHSDHTGGLQALLDTGIRPVVYAPSEFSKALAFSKAFKEQVRARTELVEVTDPLTIVPGVHVTRPVGDTIVEQALAVETRDGTLVVVGCAHPGLAEMVRQAQEVVPGQIALLAGGFHEQPESESELAELRRLDVQGVMPTHCTGPAAMDLLRTGFGNNYHDGGVGRTATIPTK